MKNTSTVNTMQHNISMMNFRKAPGEVFDHVWFKGDSYIVERNKKPVAVIASLEADREYRQLIQEKVKDITDKVSNNTALDEEEFQFLVKHTDYPTHRKEALCSSTSMHVLSQFGGAEGLQEAKE